MISEWLHSHTLSDHYIVVSYAFSSSIYDVNFQMFAKGTQSLIEKHQDIESF